MRSYCPPRTVTEISFWHITTKTWAYSRLFWFFFNVCKKSPPPTKITFCQIQWEINFDFFKYWPKCSKKIRTVNIWHFIKKKMLSVFIPDQKNANTGICIFHVFSGSALPEVQNKIWKQFSDNVLYNHCSKSFLKRRLVFEKVRKRGFPTVF